MPKNSRIRSRKQLPGEPKYIWINKALTKYIKNNLNPGDAVPSERNLAEEFGTSRMTARKALSDLVEQRIIIRKIGHGNFVAPRNIELPVKKTSFTQDMKKRGLIPSSKVLKFTTTFPDSFIQKQLEISSKTKIYRILRLRLANNEPMALEQINFNSERLPDLEKQDLDNNSVYEILENIYKLSFDSGIQKIKAKKVTPKESKLLQIPTGSAALHLTRITSWNSQKLECTISVYRADRYELITKL